MRVSNEIMSELERLNLKIKTPMLIQKIGTQRYEVKTQDGLLVLDKTTFLKDIVDYELEFEATSFEKGKIAFENLLTEFDITNKPAKPKIARALEYAKGEKNILSRFLYYCAKNKPNHNSTKKVNSVTVHHCYAIILNSLLF